uniref:CHCH domain-containing protein n=1 Tax=viral metagenome TaxID=1070528 RepID=A0A6C0J3D1_9ZZZZ
MGRRSSSQTSKSRTPRSKSMPNIRNNQNKHPTINQQPTVNQQPTMTSTIGQGVALGTGAAIGSSMVHGAMDMMSGKQVENPPVTQPVQQNNSFNCQQILESFQNCMYSTNDIEVCKPQLDLFKKCSKEI